MAYIVFKEGIQKLNLRELSYEARAQIVQE